MFILKCKLRLWSKMREENGWEKRIRDMRLFEGPTGPSSYGPCWGYPFVALCPPVLDFF